MISKINLGVFIECIPIAYTNTVLHNTKYMSSTDLWPVYSLPVYVRQFTVVGQEMWLCLIGYLYE